MTLTAGRAEADLTGLKLTWTVTGGAVCDYPPGQQPQLHSTVPGGGGQSVITTLGNSPSSTAPLLQRHRARTPPAAALRPTSEEDRVGQREEEGVFDLTCSNI
ncbi:unnamed protein product [Boreogadus saida]